MEKVHFESRKIESHVPTTELGIRPSSSFSVSRLRLATENRLVTEMPSVRSRGEITISAPQTSDPHSIRARSIRTISAEPTKIKTGKYFCLRGFEPTLYSRRRPQIRPKIFLVGCFGGFFPAFSPETKYF